MGQEVSMKQQSNKGEGILYVFLLFIILESLVYSIIKGFNLNAQLISLTAILIISLTVTFMQLSYKLYISNLLIGLITVLVLIHNSFYLQGLTDVTWLKWLYRDLEVSLTNLRKANFVGILPTAYFLVLFSVTWLVAWLTLRRLIIKRKFLGIVLIGIMIQGFIFSYIQRSLTVGNFTFVLAAMLLLSFVRLGKLQFQWQKDGTFGRQDIIFSWAIKSTLFIVLIVCMAALLPGLKASILQGNQTLITVASWFNGQVPAAGSGGQGGDQADKDKTSKTTESKYQKTSFGWSDGNLGGPWRESDIPVMTVKSEDGLYLRGGAKEVYTGKGWAEKSGKDPVGNPLEYKGISTKQTEQTIHMSQRFGSSPVVFGATMPLTVEGLDKPVKIDANGNLRIEYLQGGTSYLAISQIPVLDEDSKRALRASGSNYPEAIKKMYLDLPPMPSRVGELAKEITAGKDNPYDKALALEGYFKNNPGFVYDKNPPATPLDRDFVDYFLFDLKKGYCTYYSTSMAVMARAVGLPSRWVTGYTEGESSEKTPEIYNITSANQHAWVEIYFNGIGWLPFEPTKGFSISTLGSSETPQTPVQQPEASPEEVKADSKLTTLKLLSVIVACVLAAFGVIIFRRRANAGRAPDYSKLIARRRSARKLIINTYRVFLRLMMKIGRGKPPAQTAREFASGQEGYFGSLSPYLHDLTLAFEEACYKKEGPGLEQAEYAEADLEELRRSIKSKSEQK